MKKRKRLLKIVLLVFLGTCLLVLGTGFYLYRNLTGLVVYFVNRTNPELELKAERISLSGGSEVVLKNLNLHLRETQEQVLMIPEATLRFSWKELWKHRVREIIVRNPQIYANDALTKSFSTEGEGAGEISIDPETLWRVEKLEVLNGSARANLSGMPLIGLGFETRLRSVYLSPELKYSNALQAIELRAIKLQPRDKTQKPLLAIDKIAARFYLDRIENKEVESLVITGPKIVVSPAGLKDFVKNADKPVQSDQSSQAAEKNTTYWRINTFEINDGEIAASGFGNETPEIKSRFSVSAVKEGQGSVDPEKHLRFSNVELSTAFATGKPFLTVQNIGVGFSWKELFVDQRIGTLEIETPVFHFNREFRSILSSSDNSSINKEKQKGVIHSKPYTIGKFYLKNGKIIAADLGAGVPDIPFGLETEMNDIALSALPEYANQQIQTLELADINLSSPIDPFIPVLNLSTVFIRFSLAGLLRQEIEEIKILNPALYVGEDLFWYVDFVQNRKTDEVSSPDPASLPPPAPPVTDQPSWRIRKFSAHYGQLILALEGQAKLAQPLTFQTQMENLDFRNLGELRLKLDIDVPPQPYENASYQLKLTNIRGKIQFSLPPEKNANNLVQTLRLDAVKWKDYLGEDFWLSVTYDEKGIYGGLGGNAYSGYLNGGFNFYFNEGTPWAGWISGENVDLKKFTDILSPQRLQMSGPAGFKMEVNGLNHWIQRVKGSFANDKGGVLRIDKLDEFIEAMPPEWSSIKKGLTKIGLETLRDFEYQTATSDFWFVDREGNFKLTLRGPTGSRNIDIVLHDEKTD